MPATPDEPRHIALRRPGDRGARAERFLGSAHLNVAGSDPLRSTTPRTRRTRR